MRRLVASALLVATLGGCGRPAPAPLPPAPLPADAYAHYLRGRLAQQRGDHPVAVAALAAAAGAAPDEPMLSVALADALHVAGRRDDALRVAVAATRRWPRHPAPWLEAGALHRARGEPELARDAFDRARTLDRGDERAWLGLAEAWEALGDRGRAERVYRELLAVLPASLDGRFRLGELRLARGDDAGGRRELRRVLDDEPDHVDARLALARSLRRGGALAEAVAETRQAFDRTAGDPGIAEELFWLLCEADDRRGALDLLGLLDDAQADAELRLGLASLYRAVGEFGPALRLADGLAAAGGRAGAAAALLAAAARLDRGGPGDGEAALAAAAGLVDDPAHGPAARALAAGVLRGRGDLPGARAVLDPGLAATPDDAELVAAHAAVLRAERGVDAGREALQAARARRPDSAPLTLALARYEGDAGGPARAAALAEAVLEAHPDHVGALHLAGHARAEAGVELERARAHLRRARELAPGDPGVLGSWGWLLWRLGDAPAAEAALAHAARLAPHVAEIRDHLRQVRSSRDAGAARRRGK